MNIDYKHKFYKYKLKYETLINNIENIEGGSTFSKNPRGLIPERSQPIKFTRLTTAAAAISRVESPAASRPPTAAASQLTTAPAISRVESPATESAIIAFGTDLDKTFFPAQYLGESRHTFNVYEFINHFVKNIEAFKKLKNKGFIPFVITGNNRMMTQCKFEVENLIALVKSTYRKFNPSMNSEDEKEIIKVFNVFFKNIEDKEKNIKYYESLLEVEQIDGIFNQGAILCYKNIIFEKVFLSDVTSNTNNIVLEIIQKLYDSNILYDVGITLFGIENEDKEFISFIKDSKKELYQTHHERLLVKDIIKKEGISIDELKKLQITMMVIIFGKDGNEGITNKVLIEEYLKNDLSKNESFKYNGKNTNVNIVPKKCLELSSMTTPTNEIDITPAGINKGQMLVTYLNYINDQNKTKPKLTLSNLAVFGDSSNDASMFTEIPNSLGNKNVGLKVAMPHTSDKTVLNNADLNSTFYDVATHFILRKFN